MRRKDIINELKICAIGFAVGAAVFASMLFFGLRAKACEIRDGVHTPIRAELVTMDRAEREALRNAHLSSESTTNCETFATSDEEDANSSPVGANTANEFQNVGSVADLDLLAALVWAEAGDQDFIGQRIVADCVLNRVRSAEWPNSVEAVIYQAGQFSVVANGRLDQGFENATPENYEAARLALSGDHYDTQVIYFSMYYCANGAFAYQHQDHYIGY